MNQKESRWKKSLRYGVPALVLLFGLGARFWMGTLGHNYDFDSYRIVVGLVEQGQNVYLGTNRYNYSPVWFNFLHLLEVLSRHNPTAFRAGLVAVLSAADAGIFWVLWKKIGLNVATLFFLNPVSVMITGYHNQFDNIAVLLGLWAVLLYGEDFASPLDRRKYSALLLLGFSIMTKHIFFAFPLWLAVKQKGLAQKAAVLFLPPLIFFLSFAPYWTIGNEGIRSNVFLYGSCPTAYLYKMLAPTLIQYTFNPKIVWLLVLGLFAFLVRRRPAFESLLLYTAVMVTAAPATTNEYLAIPAAYASVFVNFFTISYTLISTCHVAAGHDGPHLLNPDVGGTDDLAIYALALAVAWHLWRENLFALLINCRREIAIQLGWDKETR